MTQQDCDEIITNTIGFGVERYYVMSLSKQEDFLPIWHIYANCGGYNIQFDSLKLIKNMRSEQSMDPEYESYENLSCPVFYTHGQIAERIKFAYDNCLSKITDVKSRISGLLSLLVVCSAFTKSKHYQFEDEYRILVAKLCDPQNPKSDGEVKYRLREGSDLVVPYLAIPIKNQGKEWPITGIKLGPLNNNTSSIHGVQKILDSCGLSKDIVSVSEIPYKSSKN